MKKLISLMLALIMVLSLATVASAEEGDAATSTAPALDNETTITFTKTYEILGGTFDEANANSYVPSENISFTVTPDNENPGLATANNCPTIASQTVTSTTTTFTLTLPTYSAAGKYNYTVTESTNASNGTVQGVTYAGTTFDVSVLAYYIDKEDGTQTIATDIYLTTGDGNDGKVSNFTNTYKLNGLDVTKTVDGNAGSKSEYFDFSVTFTSSKAVKTPINVSGGSTEAGNLTVINASDWSNNTVTKTFKLKHGETLHFDNIPDGVTYAVTEDSKHIGDAEANANDPTKGYTSTPTGASGSITYNEEGTDAVASFLNVKNLNVATGIVTDSAPYVILIAVCAVAAVAFVLKRRNAVEF